MKPALALAAFFVLASVGPSHSAATWRCATAHGRTVAATRDARVYRDRGRTFACRYDTNRRFWLKDEPAEPDALDVEEIRLAGRYIGYELAFYGRIDSRFWVRVRDLRTGRWLVHRDAVTFDPVNEDPKASSGVTDLELTRTGAVAWIAHNPYLRPLRLEVHKVDADGHAVLATGADIDPRSLALSDARVYWLQGGQPKTSALAAPWRR